MNCKLDVIRYTNNDVIATSHYSVAGMSTKSYQLFYDEDGESGVCDWLLYGNGNTNIQPVDGYGNITYFDENGQQQTTYAWDWDPNDTNYTGKWFHYVGNTYILCDDESHHYN